MDQDIDKIKAIIAEKSKRFDSKMGAVAFAGVEGGTVEIDTVSAAKFADISGKTLATRNTPAATMVAAWIRALTGVGPAMASGRQTYSGICALLPVAPRNSSSVIPVISAPPEA